jgi:hypothetical protein
VKLYHIRIRPERSPEVQRVFEFAARHTLLDVHKAIQRAFELDDDHLHAFFLSGRHWDRASEIASGSTPFELGRTARVRLHELRLELGQRIAYVFDFGDELWHSLEIEALVDSDTAPLEPRLLESIGVPAPDGGDGAAAAPDVSALVPLANEFIALFPESAPGDVDDDDDDDEYDEDDGELDDDELDLDDDEDDDTSALDLSPDELDAAHALAKQLAFEVNADSARFMALQQACNTDLLSLLADLPAALALAEKVDDGVEIAQLFAFLDPPHFLGERALLLAEAGRREEALAQVTENLESMAGDAWVEVKAADAYAALGDSDRAEAVLRAVLARKVVDAPARDGAVDRLLELLNEQGRGAEGEALLAAERRRLDASIKARAGMEQRLAPKVGRNDPCPCGSGKKHKKCCLV